MWKEVERDEREGVREEASPNVDISYTEPNIHRLHK